MICLVSIQGNAARGFYLEGDTYDSYLTFLHSILDNQYIFINSRFKTDILYNYSENLNSYFIEHLCEHAGKSHDDCKAYFYTMEGEREALEAFFVRLYQFSQRADLYAEYIDVFDEIVSENAKHPIIRHILGCFRHINLEKFRQVNFKDHPPKQLTIDRHKTYANLIEYLSRASIN